MMPVLRCGHASAAGWRQAARRALDRLLPVPSGANLGFLYLTDQLSRDAQGLIDFFRRETGVTDWVGTVGAGVMATGAEYMGVPGLSVMVGRFPEDGFRVFSGNARPPGFDERTASGKAVAHHAVVHADPETPDMADLITDMSGKLDGGSIVGGLSSARDCSLQIANEVLQGGLSGVVLSGDIDVRVGVTQGCAPLEKTDRTWLSHRVTACRGNIIESLDGRPALDVFIDDIGASFDGDLRSAARLFLAGMPVVGAEPGDFLARDIVGMDRRARLLAVGAELEKGAPIVFCRRDAASARSDLTRMTRRLSAGLQGAPKGGLYISCIARGENMFGQACEEARIIEENLGSFPLAGFFANGEIAGGRLYAYTGVLALFA